MAAYLPLLTNDPRFSCHEHYIAGEDHPIVLLQRDSHESRYNKAVPESKDIEVDTIPQFLWPAASTLAEHIVAHRHSFAHQTVVELGSGLGLTGLLCARYCTRLVLTDCSPIALQVLQFNKDLNGGANVTVEPLRWGNAEEAEALRTKLGQPIDLVIGSEVFYHRHHVRPLLQTIRHLTSPHRPGGNPVALFTSSPWFEDLEDRLAEAAKEFGLVTIVTPHPGGSGRTLLLRIEHVVVAEQHNLAPHDVT
eukprot:GGOE01014283.1.p2 GENE.GGOE01014283.1~~GGOE01014283.1.p2  ORF type:complete len:250 (+),score=47.27 GGOE01014283.1:47-796(+)